MEFNGENVMVQRGVGIAVAAVLILSCAPETRAETSAESGRHPVRIGVAEQITALVGIAAGHENFFAAEGLDAEVTYFVSGTRALSAMTAGEIDVAIGVADVPFALQGFNSPELVILGIVGADAMLRKIMVSPKAGITKIEDFRGKRIGTQENSAVHFFLHIFLNYAGLKHSDVTVSFFPAEELPRALAEHKVDAIAMREPLLSKANQMLGGQAAVFEVPDLYYSYELLVVSGNFVRDRPEDVHAVMRAVNRSADFVKDRPREAMAIGARALSMSEADFYRDFIQVKTGLFFDQGIFLTLEDIGRWAVEEGRVSKQSPPPYEAMINLSFLESLGPHRLSEFDAP